MLGPALSGVLVKSLGFPAIVCGLGLFCFAFSPFLSFLENLPERREKNHIELHDLVEGEKTEFPYESFIEEKDCWYFIVQPVGNLILSVRFYSGISKHLINCIYSNQN